MLTNKGMGELKDGLVNGWMSELTGCMDITTDRYVNRQLDKRLHE